MKSIIKVFYAPEETFKDLKEKGTNIWIPFLFLLFLSILVALLYVNFIIYPRRIEFMQSGQIPPDAAERMQKFISRPFLTITSLLQTLIGVPTILLLTALVYHFGTELIGGKSRFEFTFLYVVYSKFINLFSHLIKFLVAFFTKKMVIHTDLALFFPFIKGKNFFYLFLTKIDIFTIWSLYVVACGMRVFGEVDKERAIIFVYSLWLVIAVLLSIIGLFGKGRVAF